MKAVLIPTSETEPGALVWRPPYFYPQHELDEALESLANLGIECRLFEEGHGLTFVDNGHKDNAALRSVFGSAFPWLKLIFRLPDAEFDIFAEVCSAAIIFLPLSRMEMYCNIHTEDISIFMRGEIRVDLLNVRLLDDLVEGNTIRDSLNELTGVSVETFASKPLAVLREERTLREYVDMTHQDDVEAIRRYAGRVDKILDIIKFIHCNYTVPGLLMSRAGLYNNRNSAALTYFLGESTGIIQSREVELKTLIDGVGIRVSVSEDIQYHKLLVYPFNETGSICRHALRLHSLIMESDNSTSKFTQIMTLIEFIGDPTSYRPLKKLKGKVIAAIANSNDEYLSWSRRIEELSAGLKDGAGNRIPGLRTEIIHNGKSLEDIIPNTTARRDLFNELEKLVSRNIQLMMDHCDLSWSEFDTLRSTKLAVLQTSP